MSSTKASVRKSLFDNFDDISSIRQNGDRSVKYTSPEPTRKQSHALKVGILVILVALVILSEFSLVCRCLT